MSKTCLDDDDIGGTLAIDLERFSGLFIGADVFFVGEDPVGFLYIFFSDGLVREVGCAGSLERPVLVSPLPKLGCYYSHGGNALPGSWPSFCSPSQGLKLLRKQYGMQRRYE